MKRIEPGLGKTGAGFTTDCVKCMGCVVACSFWREGKVNPKLSRIRIKSHELDWVKGKSDKIVERIVCKQCPGISPCMLACAVEAMTRDENTGAVVIDDKKCTRCKKCIEACPFDAIWYNEEVDKILKCDLCGGVPKCVRWCPIGCLKIVKLKGAVK